MAYKIIPANSGFINWRGFSGDEMGSASNKNDLKGTNVRFTIEIKPVPWTLWTILNFNRQRFKYSLVKSGMIRFFSIPTNIIEEHGTLEGGVETLGKSMPMIPWSGAH